MQQATRLASGCRAAAPHSWCQHKVGKRSPYSRASFRALTGMKSPQDHLRRAGGRLPARSPHSRPLPGASRCSPGPRRTPPGPEHLALQHCRVSRHIRQPCRPAVRATGSVHALEAEIALTSFPRLLPLVVPRAVPVPHAPVTCSVPCVCHKRRTPHHTVA